MLVQHPPRSTDSFSLYVKSSVILGRVKTFNVRFKTKYNVCQESAVLSGEASAREDGSVFQDPRATSEFQIIDSDIREFVLNVPREFNDPVTAGPNKTVDPILYTALLLPHVYVAEVPYPWAIVDRFSRSMILLHDPHADLASPTCPSSQRMLMATRAILELVYKITATTYDLIYLDHTCAFCWFVAGTALIRFLRFKMEAGDEVEVSRITQEIAAVRYAEGLIHVASEL